MIPLHSTAVPDSLLNRQLKKDKLIPREIGEVHVIKDSLLGRTTDPAPNILFELICHMLTGS